MERHRQDRQGRTRLSVIVPATLGWAAMGCDGLRWTGCAGWLACKFLPWLVVGRVFRRAFRA